MTNKAILLTTVIAILLSIAHTSSAQIFKASVEVSISHTSGTRTLKAKDFGLSPNNPSINASPILLQMCDSARALSAQGLKVRIQLDKGQYHFHPRQAATREYYISNHDQNQPKTVGIPLEGLRNVTFDGCGADLLFYGQMLPLSLIESTDCTLRNFSIDFPNPHIAQAVITHNDGKSLSYKMEPWVDWEVKDGTLYTRGEGWRYHANGGIAFDGNSRHLIAQTSDCSFPTSNLTTDKDGNIHAPSWKDPRLVPGTRFALRTWNRPAPALFLADDVRTTLHNIKVHYAEGMGLLAQMCTDIDINRLSICLRGKDDPRYFTTQADATHFSGCKGIIRERNGLFEGMMDDAINVHGTYLKIIERIDDHTLIGQYMHGQSYGFRWGEPGDTIQFIQSNTMEVVSAPNTIRSIAPHKGKINKGVRQFRITLTEPISKDINPFRAAYGIENLTWSPRVEFTGNTVRNNRARGSLFSTPRQVIVRNNTFDHTSGCAILLCGDCNGWYETGACRDVLIEKNKIINALTNSFQFTNAIISIYPEIPNLDKQQKYFHSGITIRRNRIQTFDKPILYAKSVDGIKFEGNTIIYNTDYAPYHWNQHTFLFERVINHDIRNNKFKLAPSLDLEHDIKQ